MKDFQLKSLISRLTGVQLVRSAMADVAGVIPIADREMKWERYQGGAMFNVPPVMKAEFDRIIGSFKSNFASSGGQTANAEEMVYAYYGKDPILSDQQAQIVQQNPQMKELLDFMQDHGLRLWKSPAGMHNWAAKNRKPYNPSGTNGGIGPDGKDKYFENFGYAWGAKKVGDYRNKRVSTFVKPEEAKVVMSDEKARADFEAQGQRLVQVVTAPKSGSFGIFFKDMDGKLYSPIGDNYYASTKTTEESPGFVDKAQFSASKGQSKKWYGFKDPESARGITLSMPTEGQFLLPNGPTDPNPQPVRRGGLAEVERGERYYLWIKNDGSLWWLLSKNRSQHLKGGGAEVLPLTEAQADFFNANKDHYFALTNPDTMVYSWDTVPPEMREEQEQDYRQKTNLMNQMYDTLMQQGQEPDVGLNAFKYCIVGPAGQHGENIDVQKTHGVMLHPQTAVPETPEKQIRRKDWVRISGEFNADRASKTGSRGYVGQAMSGKGALDGDYTLKAALTKAFRQWHINAPFPPDAEINAAQVLFDKVHYPELAPNEAPQPDPSQQALLDPTGGLGQESQPQEQPQTPVAQPPAPAAQPAPASAPQRPGSITLYHGNERHQLASNRGIIKTNGEIIRKLKRKG